MSTRALDAPPKSAKGCKGGYWSGLGPNAVPQQLDTGVLPGLAGVQPAGVMSGVVASNMTGRSLLQHANPPSVCNQGVTEISFDISSACSITIGRKYYKVCWLHEISGISELPFSAFHCNTSLHHGARPVQSRNLSWALINYALPACLLACQAAYLSACFFT